MTEMTQSPSEWPMGRWPSTKLLKSGEITAEEYSTRLSAYYRSYSANNKDKISAINKRSYQKRKTQPKMIHCEECNKDIGAIYLEKHQATQTHRLNLIIHKLAGGNSPFVDKVDACKPSTPQPQSGGNPPEAPTDTTVV